MNEPETLIGLLAHYSPSGHERGAAEWLVGRMQAVGYDRAFIDPAGNAVGVIGEGPRQVVLLGHIDTVPGEITVRLEPDGQLYGRGAVDAKGPLACFTDAAAQAGRREGWQVVVIGAVGEETDSSGARFVVDQYRPDFAVIGEPNQWDRLALGYKGSVWAQVRLVRPQAHSAGSSRSIAESAVAAWLEITAFAEQFNTGRSKLFDQLLLSLGQIESGAGEFEQWARLHVGARLPLDLPPVDWYGKMSEILARFSAGTSLTIEPTGYAIPAWKCEKNTPLVRAFLSAIRSQGGQPRFVYKTGTADLNIVAPAWGCPCLVYGPGDSACDHTPDEHIDLQDYLKGVDVLAQALNGIIP